MKLTPLTTAQQQIVLNYHPKVKSWIIDKYPVWTFHRDMVEANAFAALVQAVATWKGGSDEERDKYIWKAIHNSRKEAWRDEQKHHTDRDYIDVAYASEPDDTCPEIRELIAMMPEQEGKITDLLTAGFTADEIKDVIGTSKRTAYRRINDARESLKKLFGD